MSDLVTIRRLSDRCRGRAIVDGRWVKVADTITIVDGQEFLNEGWEFHPVRWHRMRTTIRGKDVGVAEASQQATQQRSTREVESEIEWDDVTDDGEFVSFTLTFPINEVQCDRCGHWTEVVPLV